MSFWDFVRNYINPGYLLFRIGFFMAAGMCGLMIMGGTFGTLGNLLLGGGGLWLAWTGIRPWGRGMSINDVNKKLDDLNRKYK
jgi:hypothetical protein